jgi:hypothetical protein
MVDVQTISVAVTATSLVIGIIYYIFTARTTIQTRQAQLFMQLYSKWQDKEFNKSKHFVITYPIASYEDYEGIARAERAIVNLEK